MPEWKQENLQSEGYDKSVRTRERTVRLGSMKTLHRMFCCGQRRVWGGNKGFGLRQVRLANELDCFFFFLLFVVLGFEFRASHLLSRCCSA
jgi:hypothetical protein